MSEEWRCKLTADAGDFWRRAEDFLTADPVLNSVPLTLTVQRRDGTVVDPAPPTFATVTDGAGDVVGVVLRTPPRNAMVSRMPAAALPVVVESLRGLWPDLPGVNGPEAEASRFAELWRPGGYEVEMQQRLHRLGTLTPPAGVPGECRAATTAERELLVEWSRAFVDESDQNGDRDAIGADVDLRLEQRRAYVWVCEGEPVSYTGHTLTVAGVARVGPVYTPRDRRGRGYASALVAEVSSRLVDAGADEVCLYTDLANSTSNKIYAEIGYRPVHDITSIQFTG